MPITQKSVTKKEMLLSRASAFHRMTVFNPKEGSYVEGFPFRPDAVSEYRGICEEPVVDAEDLYDLGQAAKLTVNRYNALILNSTNMLIADIDFGDRRFNRHAGAKDEKEVIDNLKELHLLDEEFSKSFYHIRKRLRVYRTHSGCRVIFTSGLFDFHHGRLNYAARSLMQFLGCDPDYLELCEVQQCFRARLTPKPWRVDGTSSHHVCELIHIEGDEFVDPAIAEQLRLHDELTLANGTSGSFLA